MSRIKEHYWDEIENKNYEQEDYGQFEAYCKEEESRTLVIKAEAVSPKFKKKVGMNGLKNSSDLFNDFEFI